MMYESSKTPNKCQCLKHTARHCVCHKPITTTFRLQQMGFRWAQVCFIVRSLAQLWKRLSWKNEVSLCGVETDSI